MRRLFFVIAFALIALAACDREQMTPMSRTENLLPEAETFQYDSALVNTTWENENKKTPAIVEFHGSINGVFHDVGHRPSPIFWHTEDGKLYIGLSPDDMRKSKGLSYRLEEGGKTLVFDRPLIAEEYGKVWKKRDKYWPVPTPTARPPRRTRVY